MNSTEIMNKYDNLYKERTLPMSETCMCWGLSVGDGWLPLIDKVSSMLNSPVYSSTISLKDGDDYIMFHYKYPYVVMKQVKEKFGLLRIYYECEFPEINNLPKHIKELPENKIKLNDIVSKSYSYVDGVIDFAEHLSGTICEVCGEDGELREGSWSKTLCDEHWKEQKR